MSPVIEKKSLQLKAGPGLLPGDLWTPPDPFALVLFAHGSGSSRHSARNQAVAAQLNTQGMATLLFDLMTVEEDLQYRNRFDIGMLARRLREASDWMTGQAAWANIPIGFFGASTGAAAALMAAAEWPSVGAIVSRGGRPDLAGASLPRVTAPTLLIVGSLDEDVLTLNEAALQQLTCEKKLEIVPGASHLFEEGDTLGQVAALAAGWFSDHLRRL
ncbi:dienelactone hydrolase family protein [Flaviaesturariibacter terrae]